MHHSIPCTLLSRVHLHSLSPCQASLLSVQSTIDQISYLFQSILNGYNKPNPGSQIVLATVNFSKAFDFVWHPAHFLKLISVDLAGCFVQWTWSFFSDRRTCVDFQNYKKSLHLSPLRCFARIHSWPCSFLCFHQRSSYVSTYFF